MVSVIDSRLSGTGSSPGLPGLHCVVFLNKTPYTHSAHLGSLTNFKSSCEFPHITKQSNPNLPRLAFDPRVGRRYFPTVRVCAARRGRYLATPDLERGIHSSDVF